MSDVDMGKTIAPRSDQLNSDDLISGSMTVTITSVKGCNDPAQPVAVHFSGDNGKPYKPGLSMRRMMVKAWGAEGKNYVGRSMTLYRDENVVFGGIKVGGIRISHMSHIDRDVVFALSESRAKRVPFTVKPLKTEPAPKARQAPTSAASTLTLTERADAFVTRYKAATTDEKMASYWAASADLRAELEAREPERLAEITEEFEALRANLGDRE